jgi:hypothetical protein
METEKWVIFALLSSYEMFRITVNINVVTASREVLNFVFRL